MADIDKSTSHISPAVSEDTFKKSVIRWLLAAVQCVCGLNREELEEINQSAQEASKKKLSFDIAQRLGIRWISNNNPTSSDSHLSMSRPPAPVISAPPHNQNKSAFTRLKEALSGREINTTDAEAENTLKSESLTKALSREKVSSTNTDIKLEKKRKNGVWGLISKSSFKLRKVLSRGKVSPANTDPKLEKATKKAKSENWGQRSQRDFHNKATQTSLTFIGDSQSPLHIPNAIFFGDTQRVAKLGQLPTLIN